MKAQYLSLVFPCLLLFTVGLILPMILGVYYSLTSWDGYTKDFPFVGLGNYVKILHDPHTLDAWWFTIRFTFWNTLIQNLLALFFAVILDTGLKARTFYRTVLFLPCLIAPIVAGFIWQHMYFDVLPGLQRAAGNQDQFRPVRKEQHGASRAADRQQLAVRRLLDAHLPCRPPVDSPGAVRGRPCGRGDSWTRFLRITIPMLAPAFTICIVGITVGSLRVYDLLVSATSGGPGRASTSIIYQIYNTALNARQYGYGSALSISLIIVLLIIAVIQLGILRRREVQL